MKGKRGEREGREGGCGVWVWVYGVRACVCACTPARLRACAPARAVRWSIWAPCALRKRFHRYKKVFLCEMYLIFLEVMERIHT